MVKRSIEQNLRLEDFEVRNGNHETNAVVKNPRVKQREQSSLEDCWHGKLPGSVQKETVAVSRHDVDKRAKIDTAESFPGSSTQQNVKNASGTKSLRSRSPSGKMAQLPCKDYLKGTCTSPFCEK